jgi:hypothetical protein
MNTKFFSIIIMALLTFVCGSAEDRVTVQKESGEWQPFTYPKIGLKIQLPNWKADIEDQSRMWSLFAYPLVEKPAADVQYRVVISAHKFTREQHRRFFPESGTNSTDWMNSQHMQTSQMTNAFWIYVRRDVFGSNGFAYNCSGRINRDAHLKPKDMNRLDEDEKKLATEVRQILNSIEVLSTNLVTKP